MPDFWVDVVEDVVVVVLDRDESDEEVVVDEAESWAMLPPELPQAVSPKAHASTAETNRIVIL